MKIRCESKASEAELYIYGVVGEDFFSEGITDAMVAEALGSLDSKVKTLNVRINSPGGDSSHALAIYNLLTQGKYRVTTTNDGWAASAASIIFMAGDTRRIAENALVMIHNAWTIAIGNKADMEKTIEVLDKVDSSQVITLSKRTGMDAGKIMKMLEAETWMTADEAVEMGFADEIIAAKDDKEVAAMQKSAVFAKVAAQYRNAPKPGSFNLTIPAGIWAPSSETTVTVNVTDVYGIQIVTPDHQMRQRRLDLLRVSA